MNKNRRIVMIVIEVLYIITAMFCVGVGIYYHIKHGFDKSWLFYGIGIISLGMFGVRRIQRRNLERRESRK
ncbi:MAG: hypothetical protein QM212_05360 [Bacteroidota bacterium]|jgi:formate hydrogenlyase subunit 3/multisubunit Na+/H+ antiporter MnhD subunit|nr:hypothetical protein [Bacteroidales bacterium]MDI9535390.1 hypothetical protein [Bacteroidota bacterium]OQC45429.1 MAG: hypothetical protein BWX59_01223 [Bacteroidetes bacterium ADurb.Bin028]NLP19656.1 hypothetical protein [Bacteroidales bacterium]HNY43542.1 hypothetical protein [Bacteroidales bacterium]